MYTSSRVGTNMVVVVLESFLYGISLVLFYIGFHLRISRFASRSIRDGLWWHPVVISTVAIFLTSTGHWLLTIIGFFHAVLESQADGGADAYHSCNSCLTQNVGNALVLVTLWIGEAVIFSMVHRLWVIWNRELRVIALPVISFLGLIACGSTGLFAIFHHDTYTFNEKTMTANWILRLIRLRLSAFIAWRVLGARQEAHETEARPLMSVLAVLVESAAILAAWTVFYAVTYETDSELQVVAINLTAQVTGLANMLIHIRLGMARTMRPRTGTQSSDANGVVMTSHASLFGVNFPTTTNSEYHESDCPATDKELEPSPHFGECSTTDGRRHALAPCALMNIVNVANRC
ncbi:hypothetical protein GGX14DRAFT_432432 [Mycena pura]|uniref:Uncharacterized protein n=1 Tax=Mycena pura TaxID=153505 RepID=A0AAD6YH09_9AGAR|nr:hypothetical protein GGX14DRAFT_432432 [Mycena pura]